MRISASVGIVTAALALSALAVPAAQAEPKPGVSASKTTAFAAASGDESRGDTKIYGISVGGANNVVVAATQKKTFTISVTATDDSGIQDAYAALWHGPDLRHADGMLLPNLGGGQVGNCTKVTATMSTCEVKIVVDARTDLSNSLAGTWKVWTAAVANDGDHILREAFSTARVQRSAQLTVDAAPEPVKKGRTLTVTGRLTHASWTDGRSVPYTGQPVKLQFRKKGTDTFATLKTVTTDRKGNLRTTVRATADGDYRYNFFGNSSNPWTTSHLDSIDVR
ncbi:DUF5707 domain-containing protein [Streptomyces sp. NPDC059582]|uniref:DUF5707 domain-containing protein n=1 Tax=Streptomyces sp. NPDC059582 TaxID=3346875 RepID=UPI00367CB340